MKQEEIQALINSKKGVLIYFFGDNCSVCKVLRPKIDEAFKENFSEIERVYIDAEKNQELAASYSVFTIPTLLIYLGGKEFFRESRNMSVSAVVEKVARPYEILTT